MECVPSAACKLKHLESIVLMFNLRAFGWNLALFIINKDSSSSHHIRHQQRLETEQIH